VADEASLHDGIETFGYSVQSLLKLCNAHLIQVDGVDTEPAETRFDVGSDL